MCDCNHDDAATVTRRTLLLGLGGAGLAAATGALTPAFAAIDRGRTIRFLRYHSGERLTAHYFSHGHYRDAVLQRVNRLCRDLLQKQETAMDVHLLDYVYAVAKAVDPHALVEIISAYRTPKTNSWLRSKSTNVAKHSLHMQGRAMDIRIHGHEPEEVADVARGLKRGGVGLYITSAFVHLDTGKPRFWEITPEKTREGRLAAEANAKHTQVVALREPKAARSVSLQPSLRPDAGTALRSVRALPTIRPF